MTVIYPPQLPPDMLTPANWPETLPLMGGNLIACDHCGIVALDTPAFGWRRWQVTGESTFGDAGGEIELAGVYQHHCAQAVERNSWIAGGLVHMMAPDEATVYEDLDVWVAELVGAHDD